MAAQAQASASLEALRRLTDQAAVAHELGLLAAAELRADDALEDLLTHRRGVADLVARLHAQRPKLLSLAGQVSALAAAVHKTDALADRISAQVRALDQQQTRAQTALKQLDDVLEIKARGPAARCTPFLRRRLTASTTPTTPTDGRTHSAGCTGPWRL
jgi:chorismate mutase